MLISDDYRKQNALLHENNPKYGTGHPAFVSTVLSASSACEATSILDYGCGKGWLRAELGRHVREYDPAVPGKDIEPVSADLVVCLDVLEHVEPQYLDAVLDHIRVLSIKGALLIIDSLPANKTLPDGRNAHLIQEDIDWWVPKIQQRFGSLTSGYMPTKNDEPSGLIFCLAKHQ